MNRLVVLLLAALPAAALPAQTSYSLVPFVARNASLPGTPDQVGLALTTRAGVVGTRLGGALSASRWTDRGTTTTMTTTTSTTTTTTTTTSTRLTSWSGDVDALITPTRLPGLDALFGGFDVSAFGGVGGEGARLADGRVQSVATWSYGGTIGSRLAGPIGLEAEARYRVPFALEGAAVPTAFVRGWEYRAGISFSFGGGARNDARTGTRAERNARIRVPWPAPTTRAPTRPARVSAARVLDTADDYLGTPYVYGGTSPSQGFDCSGFVRYVYARNGVQLPRTSRQMAGVGSGLPPAVAVLRPGDLVLFAQDGSRIDHVAIYAGASRIIHSSASGSGVRYDDFDTPRGRWFLDHMVAARRVIADGRSLVADLVGALADDTLVLDPPDRAPRPR